MAEFIWAFLKQPDELGRLTSYLSEKLMQEMVLSLYIDGIRAAVETPSGRHDRFGQALLHISTHCTDVFLTADGVAASLNISLRQLQRSFHDRGTSISEQIRIARVDHARRLLTDPAYAVLGLEEIAHYSGFKHSGALRQAFYTEDLTSPLNYRKREQTSRQPRPARRSRGHRSADR